MCRHPCPRSPSFQSSPSPKAGSYFINLSNAQIRFAVSILSQPEGRELLDNPHQRLIQIIVSILSQPEGRELQRRLRIAIIVVLVSILSQPEGRELLSRYRGAAALRSFNPLPARRPGATHNVPRCRPPVQGFQSSPSPKAGSYQIKYTVKHMTPCSFNPLPARRPGATRVIPPRLHFCRCFNPLPARRPGATR